jgi:hypothetical protein
MRPVLISEERVNSVFCVKNVDTNYQTSRCHAEDSIANHHGRVKTSFRKYSFVPSYRGTLEKLIVAEFV